ncbi:BadF/BadG/BcrA/BcrD ATPase family protein [Phaeobacter sp. B1627]|uniref:BadF/BadG/BcrA/BcrD ATPase family protein n=1 Tax=Phaeobacter sp. B1627 TaxID=2583809 RepID=UPI001118F89A|nr:BadF/BadG/BcrA/BcrD ATPase family protein [Phaeobacter sp. B1627]TNJ47448.1 ATPase [Phaeobacter sp. B1627]
MENSLKTSVLALDGGGTRCRLALSDGVSVIAVEAGPANISTDLDGAVLEVRNGLAQLSARTGRAISDLVACPTYIGIAGVTGDAIAGRFEAFLPFRRARITDDRPTALRGALGEGDGFVAHCGTGSFFAGQISGCAQFVGGWGAVLGDPASAQWVGRRALSCALEEVDGLRPRSGLGQLLLSRFGGASGIVAFAASARPADFGGLAPEVTRLAADGDLLAVEVLSAAAQGISDTLQKLGWQPGVRLCLTGGIAPQFRPYLPVAMQDACAVPMGTPLDGAIALAWDFAREGGE